MLSSGNALLSHSSTGAGPKAQFRAVILCGPGASLYPLVEPVGLVDDFDEDGDEEELEKEVPELGGEGGQVKALLPVAGRAMVDWVVDRVEEAGLSDILVLAPASIAPALNRHFRTRRSASSSTAVVARIEFESVPDSTSRAGNVAVLRWAVESKHIKTDFILFPCDIFLAPANPADPSSLSLATLIDRHRIEDNLVTTLFYERSAGAVLDPKKDGPSEVLTLFDPATSTLLDVRDMDDYDSDEVPIRTSLLRKYPRVAMTTSYLPTQLSIFSAETLGLFSSPVHARRVRSIEALQDLLGWISRLDWRKGGAERLLRTEDLKPEEVLAMGKSSALPPVPTLRRSGGGGPQSPTDERSGSALLNASTSRRASYARGFDSPSLNRPQEPQGGGQAVAGTRRQGTGGVKVAFWSEKDGFCTRGNTVEGWIEINRSALKQLPVPNHSAVTALHAVVSPDSQVHATTYARIGEKVSVKRSVLGKNCSVGKASRLQNVIAMDDVVIGEGVKLENCVLSSGVRIGDKATLKDCQLGRRVVVAPDAQLKNEQLVLEIDD